MTATATTTAALAAAAAVTMPPQQTACFSFARCILCCCFHFISFHFSRLLVLSVGMNFFAHCLFLSQTQFQYSLAHIYTHNRVHTLTLQNRQFRFLAFDSVRSLSFTLVHLACEKLTKKLMMNPLCGVPCTPLYTHRHRSIAMWLR